MTNLDYIKTLSAEELYQVLFVEVKDMSMNYTNSRLFIIDWLKGDRDEYVLHKPQIIYD